MSDVSMEKLVGVYAKMYAKKTEIDRELKELDQKMKQVKVAINDHMRELGLESIKTAAGTAYRTVKTTYIPSDWGMMHQFIVERNLLDLLEKRLHQGNLQAYMEENPEDIPPGLNANMEYSVTVRRAKN